MAHLKVARDTLLKVAAVMLLANIFIFIFASAAFSNVFQTQKYNSNVIAINNYANKVDEYDQMVTDKANSLFSWVENYSIHDVFDDAKEATQANIGVHLSETRRNYSICNLGEYFSRNKQDIFPFKKNKRWPETKDFLCEPELDNFTKKTLFIYVESAPWNFEKRALIRKTWASAEYYRRNAVKTPFLVVVIFVIGIPDSGSARRRSSVELITRLGREMSERRDVLLINMSDHYDHLTYKGIAALTWIEQNAGDAATHVFKTDDDSFVNVMGWMTIIIRLGRVTRSGSYIVGTKCVYRSPVVRDPKIRPNPVTYKEYARRFYPPYCMGSGYLMSRAAVRAMLRAIPGVPFLRVEDVYFTGLAAIAANITRYWTSSTTEKESIHLIHIHDVRNMPLIVHHLSARSTFWQFLWFMNKAAYEKSVLDWNKYPVKYFAGPHVGIDNLD